MSSQYKKFQAAMASHTPQVVKVNPPAMTERRARHLKRSKGRKAIGICGDAPQWMHDYYGNSVSGSVLRDYADGNVTTIEVK